MFNSYETFVRWYLRFNGYFGIENFIIHEPVPGGIRQGGEFDILAVRFPSSREFAGFEVENDVRLMQATIATRGLTDFVIAEVGGGGRKELNRIWHSPDPDGQLAHRLSYVVRWAGFFRDEETILDVAGQLQTNHWCVRDNYCLRVILFGKDRLPTVTKLGILQITFREIAEFIVTIRASCYASRGMGARSPHSQWDSMIKNIWDVADPRTTDDQEKKIEAILKLIADSTPIAKGDDESVLVP